MRCSALLLGLVISSHVASAQVVSLSFKRKLVSDPAQIRRRTVGVTTGSEFYAYQVNASVGTPRQNIELSLDTGSSDIILLTSESSFCDTDPECPQSTSYNANKSSTYTYLNSNFTSNFGFANQGEGSGASGDVATDVFRIGGTTIKNQQFDIAYGDPSISFSILGLSYASGENQVNNFGAPQYNNLPLSIAASGATNLALFTLWQDTLDSESGQLLFGGIDEATYSGELVTLPVQNRPGRSTPIAFDINMNGFSLTNTTTNSTELSSTGSTLTVIDCGTFTSLIPNTWIQPILDKFSIKYFKNNDTAIVDCNIADSKYTLDFSFNNLTIKAPIKNFVFSVSTNICNFGIVPAGNREALLGVNFLASSVVVFDLENNQVSIGVRDFGSRGGKVVAVPKEGVLGLEGVSLGGTTSVGGSGSGTSTVVGSSAIGSAVQTGWSTGTDTGSSASSTTVKKSAASSFGASSTLWIAFSAWPIASSFFAVL